MASVGTAVAASSPVAVTIGTTSAFKPVSGDTFVRFLGPNITPDAVISGTVAGIPAATTAAVTLLSKPFGASAFSAGRPVTLTLAGGAGSSSFSVAPAVATTYEVQVTETAAASPSPSPSSSAPTIGSGPVLVATSAARTVYVIADRAITGSVACARPARPVCHVNVSYTFRVPVSAIKAEMAKHLFLYSRVLLSRAGEPPAPKLLVLNTAATRGKVRKLTIRKFAFPAHYSVRVGSESFHYLISGCLQDTESKDGIGLPGRHGCGAKAVTVPGGYLG